jgi:mannose-1-phosphate guanylyltransferase/mannose-6-phosphate isomerase
MQSHPDEVLLISPADHVISDETAYQQAVSQAADLAAQGYIVTFGIQPQYPETGFGYIEAGEDIAGISAAGSPVGRVVRAFKEKPDEATAKVYLEAGNYFWNSGMFCFTAGVFLSELQAHQPEMYAACKVALEGAELIQFEQGNPAEKTAKPRLEDMQSIPSLSVDYAVMEKTSRAAVVPCSIGWSDLGSIDALFEFLGEEGNASRSGAGNVHSTGIEPVVVDSTGNLVIGEDRQVALIDVHDLYVIETPDALLVGKRGSSQKVKQVVERLEASTPRLTERFPTVERPWGRYTTLHHAPGYVVRRIQIKPGGRTSLQRHQRREELWTIASGIAEVTIELSVRSYAKGQSVEVPRGAWHQLANPAGEPLIIIETQIGEGISEEDVERR